MRRWLVVTPQYGYTEIVDEYGGPTYDICDVIEIEAETKRDAIRLGVVEMLANRERKSRRYREYQYCLDQREMGECPYTGVRAEEVPTEDTALIGGEK